MKLLGSFVAGAGVAAGAGSETGAAGAGIVRAIGAGPAMTGWKSFLFFRVILKPSFSILKTERSFFLINAMSSLMSFMSNVIRLGMASDGMLRAGF